jgi:hypothetical protein
VSAITLSRGSVEAAGRSSGSITLSRVWAKKLRTMLTSRVHPSYCLSTFGSVSQIITADDLDFCPFRTQRSPLHDILGHQRLRNGRIQIASKHSHSQHYFARVVQSMPILDSRATLNESFEGQHCLLINPGSPEPRPLKQKTE